MRPVPRRQYLIVGILFVAVAGAFSLVALGDFRLNDSQLYMAAASLKYHDGNLFPCDGLYGANGLWRFQTPVVQRAMDLFLAPSGYADLYFPFRCLVGVVTFIYLWSMFALLYRQTSSWQASAFTAVLSSAVLFTVGRSYWGVGSLASITPWTLAIVFTPLLTLAYLLRADSWRRLLLVFFVIGLLGNVHLVVAMDLTLVLAIVYLGQNRFSRAAWARAAAFCAIGVGGMLPSLIYYSVLRHSVGTGGETGASTVYEAFRMGDMGVLYPDLLKSLFDWLKSAAVILVVPGLVLLSRTYRFHLRDAQTWIWFASGALFVGFVLHGVSQLLGLAFNTLPPTIDLVQAATLAMIPLFVLFAHATVAVFRMFRPYRILLGIAFAVVLAARLLPSDNFRPARYAILETLTLPIAESDKPQAVLRHSESSREFEELRAIGQFAQWQTDGAAVFVTDLPEFRVLGRRSVVACPHDVRYYYYLAPGQLKDWLKLVHWQHVLLRPPSGSADAAAMAAFIAKQPQCRQATQWYVIYEAETAPDAGAGLEIVTPGAWGRCYKVYRVNRSPETLRTTLPAASTRP